MKKRSGSPPRLAALAPGLTGVGLALWAAGCVEPPYRNEVSVAGQGGAVTLHREDKPPEPPPTPPPAPVIIYVPATAPAVADRPAAPGPSPADVAPALTAQPAAPADPADRQRRIEQLEAHMRQEQAEVERLRPQTAPTAGPTTAP